MSFLTYHPDLSDTVYANYEQYIQDIRNFLSLKIKEADPEWLANPKGVLGDLWNKDEVYASCYFIWIASMLRDIEHRADQESKSRLQNKLRGLLHAVEPQFSQYRAELEVGLYLTNRTNLITLEPLASRGGDAKLSNQEKSPDYAFNLGETVYLEVTVFYAGILDKWQHAVDYITSTLQGRLLKKKRHLKLHLQLPLQVFSPKQKQKFNANQAIEHIWGKMRDDRGELTITDRGKIQWEPYPIVTTQASSPIDPQDLDKGEHSISPFGGWSTQISIKQIRDDIPNFMQITPFGIYHSPNLAVEASFVKESSIVTLSEDDVREANDLVLKSLTNKLNGDKRLQFPLRHQAPYLLVIKPGHYRLQGDGLFKLIEQRIWSNDSFDWISGIVLLRSRQEFSSTDRDADFVFFLNPRAACPVDKSLLNEKFGLERIGYSEQSNQQNPLSVISF